MNERVSKALTYIILVCIISTIACSFNVVYANNSYNDLILYQDYNSGRFGYKDSSGRVVLKPIYYWGLYFIDGKAPVCYDDNWVEINTKGEITRYFLREISKNTQNYSRFTRLIIEVNLKRYLERQGKEYYNEYEDMNDILAFEKALYGSQMTPDTKNNSTNDKEISIKVVDQRKAITAKFKVYVNGEEFKPSDIPVLVVEGSTMLPLKAIGDALGVNVKWDSENKRVLVGGKLEENPETGDAGTGNIGLEDDKIYSATTATFSVYVNGEEFKPSGVPVLVVEGRTMLPLKPIGDALGVPVKWDNENKRVLVGETVPKNNTEDTELTNSTSSSNEENNDYIMKKGPITTSGVFAKLTFKAKSTGTATGAVSDAIFGDENAKEEITGTLNVSGGSTTNPSTDKTQQTTSGFIVYVDSVLATAGQEVVLSVNFGNVPSSGIGSAAMAVLYDSSKLEYLDGVAGSIVSNPDINFEVRKAKDGLVKLLFIDYEGV